MTVIHDLPDEEAEGLEEVHMTVDGLMAIGFTRGAAEFHISVREGRNDGCCVEHPNKP